MGIDVHRNVIETESTKSTNNTQGRSFRRLLASISNCPHSLNHAINIKTVRRQGLTMSMLIDEKLTDNEKVETLFERFRSGVP